MVVKLYTYELKTFLPKWPIRKGLILQWNDGWGEIAPLPGFSSETLDDAQDEILSLLPNLSTAKPRLPSVRFGIAAASQPFSLKPLKIPLGLLFDPRPGFSTLKLKLGHLSIEDAVLHVKKFLGRFKLRLDCNRSWSLDQALLFSSHFSPQDFEYLEEPVRTFSELIRFSELSGFPIAVDESVSKFPCPEIPTLVASVIKPTIVGHLPTLNMPTVLSSAFESSLGLLQIARSYPNGSPPAGLDTFRFFQEDLLVPPLKAEEGFLTWAGSDLFPLDMSKLCSVL
jgi:o-succinylbenzoate synthase